MKKLVIALAICLLSLGAAQAATLTELLEKLPVTNTGVYYNLNDSDFCFTTTFRAMEWKNLNLNLGYATTDNLVASLGYSICALEKLGIKVDVLKDLVIDVGWTLGYSRIFSDWEFNNGPNVTLSIKW